MRTYKGPILRLRPNEIFVFGSNTEGRHGKGAAAWARYYAGAIYGRSSGRQGQSYAIVTKDLNKQQHPSIHGDVIKVQIQDLYVYALKHPTIDFLIAYSAHGLNLNGYTSKEMAEFFKVWQEIPDNIVFEEGFAKLIQDIS